MTARTALQHVTHATRKRAQAADEYRAAIIAARASGATLRQIADAAGTGPPNVLRIIRRAEGTGNRPACAHCGARPDTTGRYRHAADCPVHEAVSAIIRRNTKGKRP